MGELIVNVDAIPHDTARNYSDDSDFPSNVILIHEPLATSGGTLLTVNMDIPGYQRIYLTVTFNTHEDYALVSFRRMLRILLQDKGIAVFGGNQVSDRNRYDDNSGFIIPFEEVDEIFPQNTTPYTIDKIEPPKTEYIWGMDSGRLDKVIVEGELFVRQDNGMVVTDGAGDSHPLYLFDDSTGEVKQIIFKGRIFEKRTEPGDIIVNVPPVDTTEFQKKLSEQFAELHGRMNVAVTAEIQKGLQLPDNELNRRISELQERLREFGGYTNDKLDLVRYLLTRFERDQGSLAHRLHEKQIEPSIVTLTNRIQHILLDGVIVDEENPLVKDWKNRYYWFNRQLNTQPEYNPEGLIRDPYSCWY